MAKVKEFCPLCKKRVFDILEWNGRTVIQIKCPRCGNIVVIEKNTS